ncbi:MAG TPA: phosphoglycerate kinase, partial [Flavobacterium sp.]|nr:phosphoglycerate kinase [Flavobacterium sp.]
MVNKIVYLRFKTIQRHKITMKTINDFNFSNKKAIIRVDFNVPLNERFEVTDDNRIVAAKPTIDKIVNEGGIAVLMSHLGRPKNGPEDQFSLKHIVPKVEEVLGRKVTFVNDSVGSEVEEIVANAQPGDVILLENLRFYKEEEKGDESFAGQLAQLGDVYVNDAFGTAHRAHASTTIIAKFFPNNKCFGFLLAKEIESIDKVLNSTEKPVTAV